MIKCCKKVTIHIQVLLTILTAFHFLTPIYAGEEPKELNNAGFEKFFDTYFSDKMNENKIAGAVTAVVKDDSILFMKGYGYSDVKAKKIVDPEKTVFILGSLSKIFTWTAVMQLAEQGKLNLEADINTYLDFRIPASYSQPITLNNLMAHNSGFEDNKFGQMAADAAQLIPLGIWLKTHIPARVRRPGEFSAYSNYGAALAGYIIERVSGMSYDEYVEKNILFPLGMIHTSSRQPAPTVLRDNLSKCYLYVDGQYKAQPGFNVVLHVAPAGSFVSSASDIARFMIANLNNGNYSGISILKPETAALMHTRSFSHDININGMTSGFWELDMNNQRIIGHAGSHFIFNSLLMLFPEQKLGVFIATNSRGGSALFGESYFTFQQTFVNHFFSKNKTILIPVKDFSSQANLFNGNYHMTYSRSESTPEKLFGLIMSINVQSEGNGIVVGLPDGNKKFIETEPFVFHQVDGDAKIIFHKDNSGEISYAFLSTVPLTALIKSRWYETSQFNLAILGLSIIFFLSFLIIAVINFIVKQKRCKLLVSVPMIKLALASALIASLFGLIILFLVFSSLFNIYGLYVGNLPLWKFVPVLSLIFTLLSVCMTVFTFLAWKNKYWGLIGNIYYSIVCTSTLSIVWFMYYWNILGKSF